MKTTKDLISEYEYNEWSCNGRLSGIDVAIVNLRETKEMAKYDCIITDEDSKKRFNECFIPLKFLKERGE